MCKQMMKEIGMAAICIIICLVSPKIVKAGETVTGGATISEAVLVEMEKEYTTTTSDSWLKIYVPADPLYIGVGYDNYTKIEGYCGQDTDSYLEHRISGTKLGDITDYWDCYHTYYMEPQPIKGEQYYYFHVTSSKADCCTVRFVCDLKGFSDLSSKRTIMMNIEYKDEAYCKIESYNQFVAPATGKYKIIMNTKNASVMGELYYKDFTKVESLFCPKNEKKEYIVSLIQGMTYYLEFYETPVENSISKAGYTFLISNAKVSNIALNESNVTLSKGGQALLAASVSPEQAVDKSVTYTSSNPSVAIVSEEGLVTALMGGTAVITATANDGSGIQAFCQVNVLPTYVTRLELDKSSIAWDIAELKENAWDDEYDSCEIAATVYPIDADNGSVTFTSSNSAVISVESATGKLTPHKAGTAVITCQTNDGSNLVQSCTVTLTESHFAGEKKTIDKLKYKVTSDSYGGGTVVVYGVSNKNQSSYKIPNTVRIDGYSYKVTEIGKRAFANLKKMNKITVGTNVKTIGNETFYNSKKLKTITIQSKKLSKVGKNALKNIHAKATIKVPSSKLSKYKKLFKNKGQKSTVKIKKG